MKRFFSSHSLSLSSFLYCVYVYHSLVNVKWLEYKILGVMYTLLLLDNQHLECFSENHYVLSTDFFSFSFSLLRSFHDVKFPFVYPYFLLLLVFSFFTPDHLTMQSFPQNSLKIQNVVVSNALLKTDFIYI